MLMLASLHGIRRPASSKEERRSLMKCKSVLLTSKGTSEFLPLYSAPILLYRLSFMGRRLKSKLHVA